MSRVLLDHSGWPAFPVSVSYVLESWASHHDYLAFLCELEIWTQFSCLQANVSPMSHIFSSPKCVFLNSLQSFSKRRINNLGTVCIAFCYCGQELLHGGKFYLAYSLRVHSIMVGKAWYQTVWLLAQFWADHETVKDSSSLPASMFIQSRTPALGVDPPLLSSAYSPWKYLHRHTEVLFRSYIV